jgi:hypothetical protein
MEFTLENVIQEAKKELLEWNEVKKFTDKDYETLGFVIAVFRRLEKLNNDKDPQ